jgi:hypothetical protein
VMWIPQHGRRNRSRKAKCAYRIDWCRNLSEQLGVHLLFGVALLEIGTFLGMGRHAASSWPFSITTAILSPSS